MPGKVLDTQDTAKLGGSQTPDPPSEAHIPVRKGIASAPPIWECERETLLSLEGGSPGTGSC